MQSSKVQIRQKGISNYQTLFAIVFVTLFATSHSVYANSEKAKSKTKGKPEAADSSGCDDIFTGKGDFALLGSGETAPADKVFQASREKYNLTELVSGDVDVNLAVKHPFVVMSAAQKLYHIVMSEGAEKENLRFKGPVTIYNLFSDVSPSSGGKRIVGQEPEIASVVDGIREAIRGSVKVPFLLGPHGTGKTLFQEIFGNALWDKTLNDPNSYYLSYQFVNLEDIPGADVMGDTYSAPLHDSPLTLLPRETQERVIKFAQQNNPELVHLVGILNPPHEPDPHSATIRKSILKYYASRQETPMTEKEIIEALAKHVVIRRKILGEPGTAPVVDAQGRDYSPGELFLAKDPINAHVVEDRSRNPLAWTYGIVPAANGSIAFLDEFPRNKKTLRDMFLRTFESRQVSLSGQTVPVDTFFFAAGNIESLEDMAEGGDSKAQADRLAPINFVWSIYPQEVAKTILYMYGEVYARKLGQEFEGDEGIGKANLEEIFPRTRVGEKVLTSDGRYELWLGEGKDRVHVSPRTLMILADLSVSTRIHFEGAEALVKEANFTAQTTVYNHPVERLKYLNGDLELGETTPKELDDYSVLMEEGHFGLSQRDTVEILREAANRAREGEGELTPGIMLETIRDMIMSKKKKVELFSRMAGDKDSIRKLWNGLTSLISHQILLPSLRDDVLSSIAGSNDLVVRTYETVVREILAMGSGASQYTDPQSGGLKTIDGQRLKAIEKIYEEENKANLDTQQIATMYAMSMANGSRGEPDSKLLKAIQAYYAREAIRTISLSSLSHYAASGEGGEAVGLAYNGLEKAMSKLGYSEVGLRQTLALVEVLEERVAQAEQQKNN